MFGHGEAMVEYSGGRQVHHLMMGFSSVPPYFLQDVSVEGCSSKFTDWFMFLPDDLPIWG